MGYSDIFEQIAEVILEDPVARQAYVSSMNREISFTEALAIMVVHFWRESRQLKKNLMGYVLTHASPYPIPDFGE